MDKLLLAAGAQGALVQRLQERLAAAGVSPGTPDGDYGRLTAGAVKLFRRRKGLPPGEHVDAPMWLAAVGRPLPPLRDRALQVTAAFEGHGWGLVQGNFDGAMVTWGIIGFTLRHGEVQRIVLEAHRRDPGLVSRPFGAKSAELLAVMRAPAARQLEWANSVSRGRQLAGVAEPWKSAFKRFGDQEPVRTIQLERVEVRWNSARTTARELGLKTELGLALCFDIVVQNGSVKPSARQQIAREVAAHPIHKERELRVIVANAVADASVPRWREDVRSRKLTLATGAGKVHGATYILRNWGLDSSRAT